MDNTSTQEELAMQLAGEVLPEEEKKALLFQFTTYIKSCSSSGVGLPEIRQKFFDDIASKIPVSTTMLSYLWDEAVEKSSRALESVSARLAPSLKRSMEDVKSSAEMEKWPFRIIKATRIGELCRLTLDMENRGAPVPMTMEIKDLYSQQRFREQFTVSTGMVLDRVKAKAFDSFISGLQIEETKDTGVSVKDMLTDVFTRVLGKMIQSDSEEEEAEAMKAKGMALSNGVLKFKLSKIKGEFELKGIKPERLAQSLEDMGAERISRGVWTWKKT